MILSKEKVSASSYCLERGALCLLPMAAQFFVSSCISLYHLCIMFVSLVSSVACLSMGNLHPGALSVQAWSSIVGACVYGRKWQNNFWLFVAHMTTLVYVYYTFACTHVIQVYILIYTELFNPAPIPVNETQTHTSSHST